MSATRYRVRSFNGNASTRMLFAPSIEELANACKRAGLGGELWDGGGIAGREIGRIDARGLVYLNTKEG